MNTTKKQDIQQQVESAPEIVEQPEEISIDVFQQTPQRRKKISDESLQDTPEIDLKDYCDDVEGCPTEKQELSLYEQIGGDQMIEKVVEKIYAEIMVKNFDLRNLRNCTPKRIELLKKQQKFFLTNLIQEENSPCNQSQTTPGGQMIKNAIKRNNAQNFQFFSRVAKKAFEDCGIKDDLLEKITNKFSEFNSSSKI